MAVSATCFVFLLTVFSVQIHARESQFFSKVPSSSGNNNVPVTATIPNKEDQSLSKQQQEPTFIPETRNGYGLYGQENNQFPTTTSETVKYEPYTTPITSTASGSFEPYTAPTTNSKDVVKYEPYTTPITSTASGSFEPYNTPTKNTVKYEPYTTPITSTASGSFEPYNDPTRNTVKYEPYTTPITSTASGSFEPYNTPTKNTVNYEPYSTPTTSTASTYAPYTTKTQTPERFNNNNYFHNKDAFEAEQENQGDSKFQQSGYTNLANKNNLYDVGNNNVVKQGMSDTRFLENGKYFHDIYNEQNYHPNQFQKNWREVASGNGFNSRGYNTRNENSYEYHNSMEGNQNEENEFDELQN